MLSPSTTFTLRSIEGEPSFEGFSPLISRLLHARGITTEAELENFLNPQYESGTHDPFLMKGMELAVARILKAITDGETIAIFSDYDADGIPGGVILSEFLKEIGGKDLFVYIPHRGTEGFGLNTSAVEEIAERGAKLLITVDCGITDVDQVARARELGLDVILTDHHITPDTLPVADAILNPKQVGCDYPFKELCGAGVVYKLIQALASQTPDFKEGREKWYLDLVGIATMADMVPLVDENRVLARYGLLVLRKTRRHGLRELFRQARANVSKALEDDVSFTIAPRINAASRMADPKAAFDLLSADTHEDARAHAQLLENLNKERKSLVARIVKDVKKTLGDEQDAPVIVTGNPHWKPGILGLVASALVDTFKKPAFVWGREPGEDGVLKGSARSDGTVDLVELMKAVPKGVFASFGGHKMSGGFSIDLVQVHDLSSHLAKAQEGCREQEPNALLYDAQLDPQDITPALFDDIERLGPFGVGNDKPLFLFQGVDLASVRLFGKEKNHLELTFKSARGSTKAIGFFMGHLMKESSLEEGGSVNFVGALEKSYFAGRLERRVRIIQLV